MRQVHLLNSMNNIIMETPQLQVFRPFLRMEQFQIESVSSLDIIEATDVINQEFSFTDNSQQFTFNNSGPQIFQLTPQSKPRDRDILLQLSRDPSSKDSAQSRKERPTPNTATPSIENIVLQYQRNEEIREFNSKFRNHFSQIFQEQPQFQSREIPSQQFQEDLQKFCQRRAPLLPNTQSSQGLCEGTAVFREPEVLQPVGANEQLKRQRNDLSLRLQEMKRQTSSLQKIYQMLEGDSLFKGKLQCLSDQNVDREVLKKCVLNYWRKYQ